MHIYIQLYTVLSAAGKFYMSIYFWFCTLRNTVSVRKPASLFLKERKKLDASFIQILMYTKPAWLTKLFCVCIGKLAPRERSRGASSNVCQPK
jgi:hypothetical protein